MKRSVRMSTGRGQGVGARHSTPWLHLQRPVGLPRRPEGEHVPPVQGVGRFRPEGAPATVRHVVRNVHRPAVARPRNGRHFQNEQGVPGHVVQARKVRRQGRNVRHRRAVGQAAETNQLHPTAGIPRRVPREEETCFRRRRVMWFMCKITATPPRV